jgi:hypothetical protein
LKKSVNLKESSRSSQRGQLSENGINQMFRTHDLDDKAASPRQSENNLDELEAMAIDVLG